MKIYKQFEKLFNIKIYSLKNKKKIFEKILNSLTKHHYRQSLLYKKILSGLNYNFKKNYTIETLPFIPIRLFKNHELKSIENNKIVRILRSSGTTSSEPSKIFLDKENSINQIKVLNKIIKNVLGENRLPMLIVDKKINTLKNNQMTARMAAINGFSIFGYDHTYLLNENEEINYSVLSDFLKKYKMSKFLIFGFTSLIFQNLLNKLKLKKNKDQWRNGIVLHGGGWKKLEKFKVNNAKFKFMLAKKLNIENIINYYGLVEQTGSIFVECMKCSRFITTEFSDIIIRDKNLKVCKENTEGMIQTISMLPTSYPGHNILTEDIGEIKGENNCKCGRLGKYFLVHGRIKEAEVRGCSNVI
jgi:phenylacetate-coenzyme A ligase PaaK-like adenylate-forming protein